MDFLVVWLRDFFPFSNISMLNLVFHYVIGFNAIAQTNFSHILFDLRTIGIKV